MPNQQPNIQEPRVRGDSGKALDLSPRVQRAFEASMQTVDLMNKAANSVAGVAIQYQEMQDYNHANASITEYHKKMSDLNAYRDSLQGTNAQEFEPEYNRKATEYHSQFVNSLSVIQNSKIREDARTKINDFNINNAAQSFGFFDKARKDVTIEGNNNVINAIGKEVVDESSIFQPNTERNFEDKMNEVEARYYSTASLIGETKEATMMKIADKKAEIAGEVARKLDEESYQFKAAQPYAHSLKFLRSLKGQVPYEDLHKEITNRLKRQIALDAVRHPEIFLDNDKKFDPATRRKYAPELDQYEYEQIMSTVEETLKRNGAMPAEAMQYAIAIVDRRLEQSERWDIAHGYISKELEEDLLRDSKVDVNDKNAVAKWREAQLDKRRKTPVNEVLNELQGLMDLQSREVWFDRQTGAEAKVSESEALQDPDRFYKYYPGNTEEVRKRIKELRRRVNSKIDNFEVWQKNPTLTEGVQYTMEEGIHLLTLKTLKDYADRKGTVIDVLAYRDAMPVIIKNLNGGLTVPNGTKEGRKLLYWNDKNTNYDNFIDMMKYKEDFDLAIYEGFNQTMGKTTLADMYRTYNPWEPVTESGTTTNRAAHFGARSTLGEALYNLGQQAERQRYRY